MATGIDLSCHAPTVLFELWRATISPISPAQVYITYGAPHVNSRVANYGQPRSTFHAPTVVFVLWRATNHGGRHVSSRVGNYG